MLKQKLTFLCQSWMKLWNQRLGFLFLWPVPWIDVLLIQSLSQISRMEVYDGVVTSLIWPILIQLNTNILTLFPRKYSSCCTNLESVAIPVVWATFMTSFWKDNISHVNTWLLVLNTFCIIKKRYWSSLSSSFWVFLSFPFFSTLRYLCVACNQGGIRMWVLCAGDLAWADTDFWTLSPSTEGKDTYLQRYLSNQLL